MAGRNYCGNAEPAIDKWCNPISKALGKVIRDDPGAMDGKAECSVGTLVAGEGVEVTDQGWLTVQRRKDKCDVTMAELEKMLSCKLGSARGVGVDAYEVPVPAWAPQRTQRRVFL